MIVVINYKVEIDYEGQNRLQGSKCKSIMHGNMVCVTYEGRITSFIYLVYKNHGLVLLF